MRALTSTLLLVMLPLIAAAIALGAYLAFASVRTNYVGLISDRLETVSRRIAADAQTALSLGLPLASQPTLLRNLTREKEADASLAVIDVVGATGTTLYSTDPQRVGQAFEAPQDDTIVGDAAIISEFGTVEGAIITTASRQKMNNALAGLARQVFWEALVVIGAAALGVVGLVWLTVRAMNQRLTTQADTQRGVRVPAESVETLNAIDAAHDGVARALRIKGHHG
ncbi:MAG: hypothetical protein AAGJ94_13885 [Pseudomonadota bacterium]